MLRLIGALLAMWLALSTPLAHAQGSAPNAAVAAGERRAEQFVRILAAPVDEQRRFVQDNFTQAAIDRRGLDALVAFLAQVRSDLGDAPPGNVRGLGDRVEFGINGPRGEALTFTVLLSAPPEAKITGFTVEPAASAAVPPPAVAEADLPQALASVVQEYVAAGFSGAVIVARNGTPVYAQAHGEADRGAHRANTLDTPFNLASDNKMFTAVLIAQLQQEGKLAWDDPVGKYLPQWPQADVRDKVTIEHLLTHTSGLGDYWGDAHRDMAPRLDTVAEYAGLFRDDAPAATPGQRFRYSNNGYVLLGLIAEKITGRDYYDLVRERIYQPLGMAHSDHYANDDASSGAALGYDREGSRPMLALRGSPAGGGYASANDLLRFATALEAGRLVSRDTLARMTTGRASMGKDAAYGYGFGVFRAREKHYGHDGGSPGANASFEVYPESGYVVIVLANVGQGSRELAQQLGGLVLARK